MRMKSSSSASPMRSGSTSTELFEHEGAWAYNVTHVKGHSAQGYGFETKQAARAASKKVTFAENESGDPEAAALEQPHLQD